MNHGETKIRPPSLSGTTMQDLIDFDNLWKAYVRNVELHNAENPEWTAISLVPLISCIEEELREAIAVFSLDITPEELTDARFLEYVADRKAEYKETERPDPEQ